MRILVVENDKGFRESWVELLKSFKNNEVMAVPSLEGLEPQGVHEQGFGLALIDRRAKDDRLEDDKTGEDFALKLCALGTPTVLVTAYVPTNSLFDFLRTGALSGIASKSMDMLELAMCVEEFKVSHRFPNCVAEFYWKQTGKRFTAEDWEKVRKRVAKTQASPEDCAVLFRSLIPASAQSVELEEITPGHGGAALFRVRVSSGDGPVVEEVAIKYGERALIGGEAMRYDRHVGPLPDGVAAHLRWRKETQKLGALAYSWVGDSVEDGVPFGPVNEHPGAPTWRRRRSALERLFSVSLNPWYRVYRSEAAKPETPIKMLDYYTGEDGYCSTVPFVTEPLPMDLPSSILVDGGFWDFGLYGRLDNPVAWLTSGEGSTLELSRYCPCHGDLHVKNIFVLPDDSPRLIDFGDTALGHVFRDFAALEVSIRLTCGNTTELEILKLAADCASRSKSLGEHIDYRSIPETYPDLREALVTTMQIRRAALDAVGDHPAESSMKEYLFAVTLRMLRYALGIADEVSSKEEAQRKTVQVWHALYGAASAARQAADQKK